MNIFLRMLVDYHGSAHYNDAHQYTGRSRKEEFRGRGRSVVARSRSVRSAGCSMNVYVVLRSNDHPAQRDV
jgi:hypothetical protein